MLAALCVTEPRRRWMSLRRRPPSVRSELISAGGGRYLEITAETGRDGGLDWVEIRHAAGREAGRILLPRGISPPIDCRVQPFQGVELARRLMMSAATSILDTVAVNPRLVQIAVYDPQAVMPELPLLFFPYAADVRVVTHRPERYVRQQYAAMEQFGAVLAVTSDAATLNGSLLLLAPDGLPERWEGAVSARGLILTTRGNLPQHTDCKGVIDGYLPRVPHSLLASTPSGCEVAHFLAGLYELSGVREIAAKPPEFLQTNGHTITLRDAAWRLAGLDIGISV